MNYELKTSLEELDRWLNLDTSAKLSSHNVVEDAKTAHALLAENQRYREALEHISEAKDWNVVEDTTVTDPFSSSGFVKGYKPSAMAIIAQRALKPEEVAE